MNVASMKQLETPPVLKLMEEKMKQFEQRITMQQTMIEQLQVENSMLQKKLITLQNAEQNHSQQVEEDHSRLQLLEQTQQANKLLFNQHSEQIEKLEKLINNDSSYMMIARPMPPHVIKVPSKSSIHGEQNNEEVYYTHCHSDVHGRVTYASTNSKFPKYIVFSKNEKGEYVIANEANKRNLSECEELKDANTIADLIARKRAYWWIESK